MLLTHLHSWPATRRGGERYLHELAAGLARAGHRPIILSTAERRSRGAIEGVQVWWLKARPGPVKKYGEFAPEVAFAAACWVSAQRRRPDVWHALGTADAAAAAIGSPLLPGTSVYTDLGIPHRPYRASRQDFGLYRRVVEKIGTYVTLSEHAAFELSVGFGRSADVIPGGIRSAAFRPHPRDPNPTLLYSGALTEPRKNVALLLEAAVALRPQVPGLQVWLSGPGDAAALVGSVPGAEKVVTRARLDPRDELCRLYGAAWVTVLPSVDEAQGLVVLESLASGTPVVVRRDGGGPPEMVDESCAVLSGSTAQELGVAIVEALELAQRPEVVAACRTRAELYDWDRVIVPRLTSAYRSSRAR
ncbi:MAG: glycosyltransferase family 4 protein [Mycobacteriales bacterium]